MPPSCIIRPLDLEGCIFQHLAMEDDRIELELRGLKLAPSAAPVVERIAVVCTTAKLLSSTDQVHIIESLPDSYRQIEGAMLLKEDTVCLSMTGGASLLVQCQALEIEHAPLGHPPELLDLSCQEDRVKGGDDKGQ